MQTEYKRDVNNNYMIIHGTRESDGESYAIRMLTEGGIPSLLKCRIMAMDGISMFYYDVTSRQSIDSLFEKRKMDREDLYLIFSGFVHAMEDMSEFLMNPCHLVVRPEYMFMDNKKESMYFCYFPEYDEEIRRQFQKFTEYVLPKINHEEEAAVILGYGIYRRALEDGFHLEHIKEEIYRKYKEAEGRTEKAEIKPPLKALEDDEIPPIQPGGGDPLPDLSEEWFPTGAKEEEASRAPAKNKGSKGKIDKLKILPPVLSMIAIMAVALLGGLHYISFLTLEKLLAAIVLLGGAGTVWAFVRERQDKKYKEEHIMEEIDELRLKRALEEADALRAEEEAAPQPDPAPKSEPEKEKSPLIYSPDQIFGRPAEEKIKNREEMREDYNETILLCESSIKGPAALISKETGAYPPIYLKEDITVIGKLKSAVDVVLNQNTVSRIHARIRREEGEYYLSDLHSRNGTAVNGRMLQGDEEYHLQDEDQVEFAHAAFIFLN